MSASAEEKSQGGTGGGDHGKPSVPPGQTVPPGQANKPPKPPKTDEEVEEILNETLPSQAEFETLARDVFLRLLPTIYSSDVLAGEPTGQTRARLERLKHHAQQVAELLAGSSDEIKTTYGLLRSRKARIIKFFT